MDPRRFYKWKNPGWPRLWFPTRHPPLTLHSSISHLCDSTAADVLEQLRYNMDLNSIKTFALYRLSSPSHHLQRIELHDKIQQVMSLIDGETEIKILFRSWICDENGKFEKLAMQEGNRVKQSNTALWLKYIEAVFMITSGKYLLTEDEAIMLGCLQLQVPPHTPHSSRTSCLLPLVAFHSNSLLGWFWRFQSFCSYNPNASNKDLNFIPCSN